MNHFITKIGLILLFLSEACLAVTRVAVLETIGDVSFSQKEKQYITDKIRERAVTILPVNHNFEIMTRENILVMLPPEKSIEDCEGTCLVETGRNISADYICQAKIDQVFGQYAVNIELYATASGKLVGSLTQRETTIDALLEDIEKESDRLFKTIVPAKKINKNTVSEESSKKNISPPQKIQKKNEVNYIEDSQGNKYRIVRIGKQTWTAENSKYKTDDSWCYNNKETNCSKFGRLYTWNAAKTVCPTGWHLPSRDEFEILINQVGGTAIAGNTLKSQNGWVKWGNGVDAFSFTALPAGRRLDYSGHYNYEGGNAFFWSSTEEDKRNAYYINLDYSYDHVDLSSFNKKDGFSVRCIKDYK